MDPTHGPSVDYPQTCLHSLISEQAARTPDAPAVSFDGVVLSYRDLDQRTNQLARYLRAKGVGPEVLVGVCAHRSIELVVALVGILKAGAAYVPIDPTYPVDRMAFMLEDADVGLLLTQEALLTALPPTRAQKVVLDSGWGQIAGESSEPLDEISNTLDLAYMIYTSGSTGKPKGALNEHRGICNRLCWMQDRYGLTTSGTVLQKTPFSFDVSVWEFFWPLMTGARLHVARPGGHQDPAYLAQVIQDETVTVVHFVPSMLRVFLEEPDSANCRSLRHVICSGEALTHDLQERFFQRFDCELHNLYGPTEAAVDVTHWTCRRGNTSRVVPIGRPVANTRIHILDDAMCPLPPGQAGELCIGGVQVGRGYHRRPDLTTERFIPDPFTAVPGARLYRTGDLARWMPDGNIEYLGRSDFQVKIRGFRIELGEIEDALASHPAVRQAVVVADDTDSGEKRLVGYLSLRADLPANDAGLRAHLAAQLPDYMVPAVFVRLPHIPLSPNGKVDRNSLPRPPRDRPELPQPAVPPQSPLQRQIALLWEAVLGIDGIGIDDRFFELGGSSLGVADLHRRLQDLLGRTFPITELFAAATIRLQAERLSPGRKDEARMDAAQERARRQRESFNLRRPARPS